MGRLICIKPRIGTLKPTLTAAATGSWRAGKTTNDRGYTYRWQKARERFLYDNPMCRMCFAKGRPVPASVVDHIEPHRGDELKFWDERNWQPLCKPCHDGEKARQERQDRA